jgi:mono/diheme cytochrome c family protein
MKLAVASLLSLGFLAAPSAFADPIRDVAAINTIVEQRCAMCHMEDEDAAPALGTVKKLEPAAIAEMLISGSMSAMTPDLTPQTKREIAVFLSGKPLPASGDLPEVTLK